MTLQVKNGEVYVKAPFFILNYQIQEFLKKNESWIEKSLQKLPQKKEKQFQEGEKFLYL